MIDRKLLLEDICAAANAGKSALGYMLSVGGILYLHDKLYGEQVMSNDPLTMIREIGTFMACMYCGAKAFAYGMECGVEALDVPVKLLRRGYDPQESDSKTLDE